MLRRAAISLFLFALSWIQLSLFVQPIKGQDYSDGWFLFGTDTVTHDAIVQLWIWGELKDSGRLPLWMPPLQGGLPTVGAFLWTPMAPSLWLHAVLPFPIAQRLQFVFALWWAAMGGFWLARVLGLSRPASLFLAIGFGFCGHLVTLIHAGHLQKVLAIAWLPWFAGGMLKALSLSAPHRHRIRGICAAALALGMAFLSGHPQIAYIMVMMLGARTLFECLVAKFAAPAAFTIALVAGVIIVLGAAVGGAQLLPGMEMSAWSNRANGVTYEEAVETSYPPDESLELFLPRHKGDNSSVGYGKYFGRWGTERIVSDYAGVVVIALALSSLFLRQRLHDRIFWVIVVSISLLVGFGKYTPIYKLLHSCWPGMKSFRSPGTFFAALALAIPVLASMTFNSLYVFLAASRAKSRAILLVTGSGIAICGLILLARNLATLEPGDPGWPRLTMLHSLGRSLGFLGIFAVVAALAASWNRSKWHHHAIAAACCAVLFFDLAGANSAFLRRESWGSYSAYLAPNEIDEWAIANLEEPRRIWEPGKELNLRQILNGRDALLGYHPISFMKYEEKLKETGLGTRQWLDQWQISHVALPDSQKIADASQWEAVVRADGQLIYKAVPPTRGIIDDADHFIHDSSSSSEYLGSSSTALPKTEWMLRSPNQSTLYVSAVTGFTGGVAENQCPGWIKQTVLRELPVNTVDTKRSISASSTTTFKWRYEPASWRIGLFCSVLALGFLFTTMQVSTRIRQDSTPPRQAANAA